MLDDVEHLLVCHQHLTHELDQATSAGPVDEGLQEQHPHAKTLVPIDYRQGEYSGVHGRLMGGPSG